LLRQSFIDKLKRYYCINL